MLTIFSNATLTLWPLTSRYVSCSQHIVITHLPSPFIDYHIVEQPKPLLTPSNTRGQKAASTFFLVKKKKGRAVFIS